MTNLSNIEEWIQENPKVNRKKLCQKFEEDNGIACAFALEHSEYQHFVKHFIHTSEDAHWWAKHIGDKEFMKHKISEPKDAFYWAYNIGDIDDMKQIVQKGDSDYWIDRWNFEFGDDQI